ncbi:hypothetical protein E2P81_ATG05716 [Venturia nashicola]|uniref:Uncharacterized protein n=1 Tax=Venturia nashicola TaxID=86259 RepID=A0A4Z1NUT3_9PEZI|nr:hypothetical protein E6O75_ATG05855 [Venturia nashicola]TLD29422.1 hypothetical protein E2P81_ATG05716 [Venturia nashicola]
MPVVQGSRGHSDEDPNIYISQEFFINPTATARDMSNAFHVTHGRNPGPSLSSSETHVSHVNQNILTRYQTCQNN